MVRRSSAALLVFSVLAALGPAQTGTKPPAPNEKMYNIGAYAGKVLDIDAKKKTMKVQVHGTTAVPKFMPGNPKS